MQMATKKEPSDTGKCHFCEKPIGRGGWCYGCEHYICDECDNNYSLMGKHSVEQHKDDPAED
jgi:hypothetical protein